MEKEKLTLENFKEVALSLLKEENGGDMTIDLIWDQGASLDKEGIEKARKLMEEIGSTKIEDGVYEYLYDLNFLTLNEKKSERNNVPFGEFRYTDELDIIKDEYSSIAFLIQSQGYEVEDIFNEEKIENSKFLKSLRFEIDEYLSIGNEGSVGFFKGKNSSNLSELFDVLDNEDNLKIPKELATVGLLGLGNYGTSHLTVELEKDIILSKDDYKVFSEFSSGNTFNEKELLLEGYFGKSNEKSMFTSTKEESFKMHEIDLDKIKDNVKEYYKGELEEVNKIVEMEK